jgi:hypothetical protein
VSEEADHGLPRALVSQLLWEATKFSSQNSSDVIFITGKNKGKSPGSEMGPANVVFIRILPEATDSTTILPGGVLSESATYFSFALGCTG